MFFLYIQNLFIENFLVINTPLVENVQNIINLSVRRRLFCKKTLDQFKKLTITAESYQEKVNILKVAVGLKINRIRQTDE